jgi:hypothetical protein
MKNAIMKYWRCWRFGWVAAVAFIVGGFGLNLMGLLVKYVSPEYDAFRITLAICVFILFGLPYIGWVLEIASGHLERYRRNENKVSESA